MARWMGVAASVVLGAMVAGVPAVAQLEGGRISAETANHPVKAIQDTETPAQKDARMAWWRDARFGMFIHWGLYSIPAGTWNGKQVPSIGEWIMNNASIPVADYKALAPQFNPTGFNAHDIVALAKAAGMKYIVITAKHHDGFAMFDSKADPFNIVAATPFKRDPLKELAEECKKQGVKLGFYYSQSQDWTAPGGFAYARKGHEVDAENHWDKAQEGSFDTYLKMKAIPQLKELLTNYKDYPVVVWFDTPGPETTAMSPERSAEVVKLLNQYPNLIWNNRLGGTYLGDTETPEQFIPPQGYPGRDWEACMTMNDTWGYKSYDTNFKSTETLVRNLVDIASKGGNYLLNIGPDSHGVVPAAEVTRLQEVGRWMKVNGEAVYGTSATLFGPEAGAFSTTEMNPKTKQPLWVPAWEWRSTTKADKVYVEIFKWPGTTLHIAKMPRTVTGAYLLAGNKKLAFQQSGDGVDVTLPAVAPDSIASVVVLRTK